MRQVTWAPRASPGPCPATPTFTEANLPFRLQREVGPRRLDHLGDLEHGDVAPGVHTGTLLGQSPGPTWK